MKKRESIGEAQLTHRIHTRITKETYDDLSRQLDRSPGHKTLSELLRTILVEKKYTVLIRDDSKQRVLEELLSIRQEFNAIGVNINQVMSRFHNEKLPESRLVKALDIIKFYQQADLRITEVITLISKISAQW